MNERTKERALRKHVTKKLTAQLVKEGGLNANGKRRGKGTSEEPYRVKHLNQVHQLFRLTMAKAGIIIPDGEGHPSYLLDDEEWKAHMDRLMAVIADPRTSDKKRALYQRALGYLMD